MKAVPDDMFELESWDNLVVKVVNITAKNLVMLQWCDGSLSMHTIDTCTKKCPDKLIAYYEWLFSGNNLAIVFSQNNRSTTDIHKLVADENDMDLENEVETDHLERILQDRAETGHAFLNDEIAIIPEPSSHSIFTPPRKAPEIVIDDDLDCLMTSVTSSVQSNSDLKVSKEASSRQKFKPLTIPTPPPGKSTNFFGKNGFEIMEPFKSPVTSGKGRKHTGSIIRKRNAESMDLVGSGGKNILKLDKYFGANRAFPNKKAKLDADRVIHLDAEVQGTSGIKSQRAMSNRRIKSTPKMKPSMLDPVILFD